MASPEIRVLLTALEQAYDRRSWHGTNLRGSIRGLRAAIEGLDAAALAETPDGSKVSNLALITGVVAHDLYHAGQIQLLKRLAPGRGRRPRR